MNYLYKLATSCLNQCFFHDTQKYQFVMLSLMLPLICAGHPLWMDCGGWLCVFPRTQIWWSTAKYCLWNCHINWHNDAPFQLSAIL